MIQSSNTMHNNIYNNKNNKKKNFSSNPNIKAETKKIEVIV